ncbi:renalase [Biomphalaria pfeifferi]|uniref:Renalase n=1 Tax=Biomphalaria pfeifferi TaxID=112525 RepID=A0AAD8BC07_BIOPF|nr:renalase [Biomphalaria pfeifferi]
MLKNMAKVLLVGSGMTGAATAALLRQHLPENSSILIWDKARGAGGRMTTTRCPEDPSITADLGAQYFTLLQEYRVRRQSVYDELLSQGVFTPLRGNIEGPSDFNQPGSQHFVSPQGSNSLVKYFLQKSSAAVRYQHQVSEVNFDSGGPVSVTTHDDITDSFDIVILTIPVPQVLQLKGSLQEWIGSNPERKKKLQNVSYSSRYAVGLFYPPKTEFEYPWCAKYISDNPCLRYIALDQDKRGVNKPNQGKSIVVHTSVPFGLAHLEVDLNSVRDEILGHVRNILPQLPKPISIKPQRWRYSQVHQVYDGEPGCVVVSTNPLVILAGDGFSQSTFDGCLDSAEAVLSAVKTHFKGELDSGL